MAFADSLVHLVCHAVKLLVWRRSPHQAPSDPEPKRAYTNAVCTSECRRRAEPCAWKTAVRGPQNWAVAIRKSGVPDTPRIGFSVSPFWYRGTELQRGRSVLPPVINVPELPGTLSLAKRPLSEPTLPVTSCGVPLPAETHTQPGMSQDLCTALSSRLITWSSYV